MSKWNLIIDVAECTNCNNCTLATMDEHIDNDWPGYSAPMPKHGHRWIDHLRKERGQAPMVDLTYVPTMCNHCDNAPCIKLAENGAVTKRSDGIVIIDPEKAKGQRKLVDSCPYGAIWWNDEKEIPQTWIFDAHLLDRGWKEPRPVQACATGALRSVFIEDSEMQRMVKDENLEVLHPEYGTKPRVYYRNLNLYTKCFIGGSVIADIEGIEECIEKSLVSLIKDGNKIAETWTDIFGDFKIDNLEPNSGNYDVEVSHPEHSSKTVSVILDESTYIGSIRL